MSKRILLTVCLFLLFIAPTLQSEPIENPLGPTCPLDPPAQITITNVNTGSISLSWPHVVDAAVYKVSLYDQTDQISLPAIYTSNNYVSIDGIDTDTHVYSIGVSASACTDPPEFGPETSILYEPGFIIIVDEIVQLNFNCPTPNLSSQFVAGAHQVLSLPMNEESDAEIHATHVFIKASSNPVRFVDFLIWVDCYQQIRFYQIAAKGVERLKAGKVIEYKYGNNLQFSFIDIAKLNCDINICNVEITYYMNCMNGSNSCNLPNIEPTCGEKMEFNINGAHLRSQNDDWPDADEATVQHRTDTPDARLKVSPNPFQDELQIEYYLPQDGMAGLRLYDARGTLQSEPVPMARQEAGAHRNRLKLPDTLAPGMYFLVLQSAQEYVTIPLVKN